MKKTTGSVAIDYVDFVKFNDRDYIHGLDTASRHAIGTSELGRALFSVRCSLSQLNDRTGNAPATQRNGDAAFLRPGTPVYAVRGWSTSCRIAARERNRAQVYLAYRSGGQHAAPRRCALKR